MSTLIKQVRADGLPRHVAVIMDGNGRWAKARGLPRVAGHQAGAQAAERLIRFAGGKLGLKNLTLFAFSTENWNRPAEEVDFLMHLLDQFITEKLKEFIREGVRLIVSGDLGGLPSQIRETVRNAIEQTAQNDRLLLNVALNYGARQEIVRACQRVASAAVAGKLNLVELDENSFACFLYTDGIPDPDIIIRTSGEMRLSNFLLWQAAYAELYFTGTLWPDFTPAELLKTIASYQKRERRFGGVRNV
ncbi:TPA: isoprenyl transferase [Candidatus Acetothermia bacterium]|nr:isoprenyl transferase [Candidatus Acetothermia bacterium]